MNRRYGNILKGKDDFCNSYHTLKGCDVSCRRKSKVSVELNDDKTEATVSVSFPWLKQAYAFAAICQAILSHMKPLVEGEDKVIVEKES